MQYCGSAKTMSYGSFTGRYLKWLYCSCARSENPGHLWQVKKLRCTSFTQKMKKQDIIHTYACIGIQSYLRNGFGTSREVSICVTRALQAKELIPALILHLNKKLHFILDSVWSSSPSKHKYLLLKLTENIMFYATTWSTYAKQRDKHLKSVQNTLEFLWSKAYKDVPTHSFLAIVLDFFVCLFQMSKYINIYCCFFFSEVSWQNTCDPLQPLHNIYLKRLDSLCSDFPVSSLAYSISKPWHCDCLRLLHFNRKILQVHSVLHKDCYSNFCNKKVCKEYIFANALAIWNNN